MSSRIFCVRLGGLPLPRAPPRPASNQLCPPLSQLQQQRCRRRSLHTSPRLSATAATHYETLGLEPGATAADIKKKYYQLSKSTHPDRNPDDPSAASRFSAVSEAYATLGNPEKRARYDRDTLPQSQASSGRSGSYSSSQAGPNGSRPASGLSKRRSTFRGPPPSFYNSGGYGAYGARASQAEADAESARRSAGQEYDGGGWSRDTSTAGGFSPGQGAQRGFDNDVPHFDRAGHYRTQENVTGRTAARKNRIYRDHVELETAAGMSQGAGFVFVALAIGLAVVIPTWLMAKTNSGRKKGDG